MCGVPGVILYVIVIKVDGRELYGVVNGVTVRTQVRFPMRSIFQLHCGPEFLIEMCTVNLSFRDGLTIPTPRLSSSSQKEDSSWKRLRETGTKFC